jgi:hypothetical protein
VHYHYFQSNPPDQSLELSFDSLEIRELCHNLHTANDAVGEYDLSALKLRLVDLDAAANAAEYLDLFQDDVTFSDDGAGFFIALGSMYLIVVQAHTKPPVDGRGQIDWSRVKRVKIAGLERLDD